MRSQLNTPSRPLRVPLSNIESRLQECVGLPYISESRKANPWKLQLPSLQRVRGSAGSQSSFSRDTPRSDSENCISEASSLNDISRRNLTPKVPSDRSEGNQVRSQNNLKKAAKGYSGRSIFSNVPSLQDVSALDDPAEKLCPPQVTAKCWAVMDANTGELLYAKKDKRKRQMASLTKMMNFLCVCKLMERYKIDPKETYVEVSKQAATMRGTSARLRTGDVVSIWDLLHGLMLPSGNDAAMVLAENFGTYIYLNSEEYKAKCDKDPEHKSKDLKNPLKYFLRLMNETAEDLELSFTYYANPHGLVNENNYSTVGDQARLTHHLLKWAIVKEVVNAKYYTCEIEQADQSIRTVTWENTNKLLGTEGWNGVKTGITTAAGPCLSAFYKSNEESYIVILLSSQTTDIRWVEAPRIVEWAIKNKNILKAMLNVKLN